MAYVGFVATLADGREVREQGSVVWDDLPDDGVARLELVEYQETGPGEYRCVPIARLDGAPGRRFFFYNEASAGRGGMGFLTAKAIGYVEGEIGVELRYDIMPAPHAFALRAALSALVAASSFIRKCTAIISERRLHHLTDALSDAAEVLERTKTDPRTTWRTFPAAELRIHDSTLRRAA